MKVHNILEFIDEIAPFKYQEDFDNNGLIIGDTNGEVKKILISIDLTKDVLAKAIEDNYDLIITHHPYIFEPIKTINDSIILDLIKNDINYIATHTNYDNGRLTELFAKKLSLQNVKKIHKGENGGFFGGIGDLEKATNISRIIKNIKHVFGISNVELIGNINDKVKKIAYGNGSTGAFINEVINSNCDIYITGETKYHEQLEYYNNNRRIIIIGHYDSEKMFSNDLQIQLKEKFNKIEVDTLNIKVSTII